MSGVALMGGTFDPIHFGHLQIADCVRNKLDLDSVIFVPAGSPPHKETSASREDRFLMTAIAIASNEKFTISRTETDRPGRSYTLDTLREFSELYGKPYFIVGADSVEQVHSWRNFAALNEMCYFVAVNRPGTSVSVPDSFISVSVPPLEISSTDIRGRVAAHESIRYLTLENVGNYISRNGLYSGVTSSNCAISAGNIYDYLHSHLSEKRLAHSISTALECIRLATRFGASVEDAYIAGLVHDCAKCMSNQTMADFCKKNKLADETLLSFPDLLHPVVGAYIAKEEFGLSDEIVSAVRWHTTGRKNMPLLEKIVYLADKNEPLRTYPEAFKARELACTNLDAALEFTLSMISEWSKSASKSVHSDSVEALKYLRKGR